MMRVKEFTDETRRTKFGNAVAKNWENIMIDEFGRPFQEYRCLWDMVTNFKLVTGVPTHIDFELNYSCNLRCPMCPQGDPEAVRPPYYRKQLGFELYKKVVDEGVQKGLMSIRYNQLNEPLMKKDLCRYISYARDKGVLDLAINTNAILLDEKWTVDLIDAGITQLRVSIDAVTSETYNKVRLGGDYETVVNNTLRFIDIRNHRNRQIPLVRVSMVMTKDNEHEEKAFIDFWKSKADFYAISHMENWVENSSEPTKHYGKKRFKNRENFRCPQSWQRATIFPNGDFIPCCAEFRRFLPVGNVRYKSLEELWHDSYVKDLRHLHLEGKWHDDPVCRACVTTGIE